MGMDGRIAPPFPPPTQSARRWPHVIWSTAAETPFTFWFLRLLSRKPRSVHTRPVSMDPCQVCSALPPLVGAGPSLLAERVGRLAFGR